MKIYNFMILFVFVLAYLAGPSQVTPVAAQGGVIYVSSVGSDTTGNGSIGNPFQTIAHALAAAVGGDEIVLRGAPAVADNRYRESVRIELPNITIRSQTGEWAVIECPVNNMNITECVRLDVDSSGSKIQNVEIIGGYYYGIMLYTRWDWGEPNRSGASNILIEGAKIHDTGRDAIKITPGCDDITIRGVEIYNTGVRDNTNAEGIDNVNGDRMIVQDSYLHDIATTGIYFKGGATDGIIERNRIERTGLAGILIGFDTSPEFFDLAVNPNYYENIRGIVRNNIVSDTPYAGIGLYAAKDAQILNNTIINTAQVGHSPIYFGITYQDWDPIATRPASINPIIQNNLISQTAGLPAECIFIRYSDDLGGLSGLSGALNMDHNLFYHAGSDCLFTDRRPGSLLEAGTFSQWQAHINGDAHSLIVNLQLAADGSLLAGSPAIDAGINSSCPATDQHGVTRPVGAYCDIGAYEYPGPRVNLITRANSNPTTAASVNFTVTFSEPMTGVDVAAPFDDFTVTMIGDVSGASVASVISDISGSVYTVSVNTGSGDGAIRLDVVNNGSILDADANHLEGGFTNGESYTIDKTAPTITSITRAEPDPTAAVKVDFTVTFSESVTGVDAGDFSLNTAGITGATIGSVRGSGATRTVTVNTGTGDGTLRLDVPLSATITDLAGNSIAGLPITSGAAYTLDKSITYYSAAANDGWVLESKEFSNVAGSRNASGNLLVGDDARNRQYRSLLYFDTSDLPNKATIAKATLKIEGTGTITGNPFATLGSLIVDMKKGLFGLEPLELTDFNAAAESGKTGSLTDMGGGLYQLTVNPRHFKYVNLFGVTQFRLRFTKDDDNDKTADFVSFFSGEASSITDQPQLIIEYYVP